MFYLQYFYRPNTSGILVLCRDEGGRPGLIYYTLNQSRLANHFPVSRWENNKADQSKLHSFLCYLVIYCSLSHVSCHKPDCGIQGDLVGGTESFGKGVKQFEIWRSTFKDYCSSLYSLFHYPIDCQAQGVYKPMSTFTGDISFILFACLKYKNIKCKNIFAKFCTF